MDVTANDRTIESVLTGGFYKVPGFQRPYSWDISNVEDFWEDVSEAGTDYFIGSMVIFQDGGTAGLVDGQQRITTVTMMLAAIRNELLKLGTTEEAEGIQTLIERKDSRGKLQFVLQAESSYPYLHAAIQSEPGKVQPVQPSKAEDRDLATAFARITELTESITLAAHMNEALSKRKQKEQARADLEQLRDKLYGLTVVLVEVGDQDDATTIFQTLNSRGKDLETADLVKAHLLQMLKAPNAQLDQARDTWEGIRQSFDESVAPISMNRFLLHAWLSRKEYVGEKELFSRIKKSVRANNARDYLSELESDAERYRTAFEPAFRSWKKPQVPLGRSLEALSLFRVQQPLPFILSVLREYDAKAIKMPVTRRALQGVERFHFLSTAIVNQPSSGGISRMYASAGRAVLQAKRPEDKAEAIDGLLSKLRDRRPTYAEFEAAFIELKSSRTRRQQARLVRYALEELGATAGVPSNVPVDTEQLTVEHLIPQGAKRPSSAPLDDVGRIGNLVLLPDALNSELEDQPFADKQQALEKASNTEVEITSATTWGPPEILDRSRRLARRAYNEVWVF